nr:MAG TPA: hypothetical protein [Caudoviricetes sp.]
MLTIAEPLGLLPPDSHAEILPCFTPIFEPNSAWLRFKDLRNVQIRSQRGKRSPPSATMIYHSNKKVKKNIKKLLTKIA